jgi:predicted secreted protein
LSRFWGYLQTEKQIIQLKNKQIFDVLFENECVGCQYVWEILSMDSMKVEKINEYFYNWSGEGKPEGFTGGRQDHRFRFKATAEGTSVIEFSYFDMKFTLVLETINEAADSLKNERATLIIDGDQIGEKTHYLSMNEKFDVRFSNECVGCADTWHINEIDTSKIELINQSSKNWSGEGQGEGFSGGTRDHIFHFTTKSVGVSVLSFSYFNMTFRTTIQTK